MHHRPTCINDLPIKESKREFRWDSSTPVPWIIPSSPTLASDLAVLRKKASMNKDVKTINRRNFLGQCASLMALGQAALVLPASAEENGPTNPMRLPGTLPRPYGERSPFERQMRLGNAGPGAPHDWGVNAPNNYNSRTPASGRDAEPVRLYPEPRPDVPSRREGRSYVASRSRGF